MPLPGGGSPPSSLVVGDCSSLLPGGVMLFLPWKSKVVSSLFEEGCPSSLEYHVSSLSSAGLIAHSFSSLI